MGSSATKTEPAAADTATPAHAPRGHNGPSHDDIRMAANKMVALQEERAQLNAKISKFRKTLKAEGHTLGVLDAVIKMLDWTPEEIKAHYAERDWYAEALRYPIGTQLEMYGTEKTPDLVREQLKWRNVGFKNGVAAIGWPDEAPDGCPPECAQSYGEGYEEGAATVRRAFVARAQKVGPVGVGPEDSEGDDTVYAEGDASAADEAASTETFVEAADGEALVEEAIELVGVGDDFDPAKEAAALTAAGFTADAPASTRIKPRLVPAG